jgi:hypothetical protein
LIRRLDNVQLAVTAGAVLGGQVHRIAASSKDRVTDRGLARRGLTITRNHTNSKDGLVTLVDGQATELTKVALLLLGHALILLEVAARTVTVTSSLSRVMTHAETLETNLAPVGGGLGWEADGIGSGLDPIKGARLKILELVDLTIVGHVVVGPFLVLTISGAVALKLASGGLIGIGRANDRVNFFEKLRIGDEKGARRLRRLVAIAVTAVALEAAEGVDVRDGRGDSCECEEGLDESHYC